MKTEIESWRTALRHGLPAKFFSRPNFEPEMCPKGDSRLERFNRQCELFDWFAFQQDFEFFVTLQFGEQLSERRTWGAVKRLAALFDYHWLGGSWAKRPGQRRTFFVAIVEQGKRCGNTHVHMLLNRPPHIVNRAVPGSWREAAQSRSLSHVFTERGRRKGVCPHGDVRFDRIGHDGDDLIKVAKYILKEYGGPNSTDVILSSEFHPRHSESPGVRNAGRD